MGDNIRFEVVKKIAETNFKLKNLDKISQLNSVSPPSVFIGSKLKYPFMNVGILSPIQREENAWVYDDAKYWAQNDFQISDVIKLRESLLNSRFRTRAGDVRRKNKFLDIAKELAVAYKPVDVEIELKRRVKVYRQKDRVTMPQAMGAPLQKARITSNVKVHQKVDKMMNDEVKASEALGILYKTNIDEYALSKILSIGALGLKKNKKLVPTRWSITATDDSLGKNLLSNIRDYKWIEDYELFFGEFMGNQYLIMLFPNVWSYELFELYYPGSSWNPSSEIKASTDFESYGGRKSYAFNCAGGYYAARLPILEYLESIKRQASVLVIRLETPSYWAALGVWVVRESVRKAIKNGVRLFDSREELLESVKKIAKIKYDFDAHQILNQSKLLLQIKNQRNLGEWF
ncbi:hypothetical protein HN832_00110 [archaeon]|jgi:DNA repair protein NreA|nr:hypothetical protein [archaeon]MBT4373647.1 hypothetical protein [archaeon]MBT4531701.1 hypothetical protein [archaeon]MBT7001813.1 hypothetical protein [archaeon]MBT7281798.1 hypothetical protein [archaeon]